MTPEVFNEVWFTPARKWWNLKLLAYEDVGVLTVREKSLEFFGRNTTLTIEGIQRVVYGRHGRDFINDWVIIDYFDGAKLNTACFADASQIGWGGVVGGTRRILDAVSKIG